MKKFISILLFTVLIIPAPAQYDYHKQALKSINYQDYLNNQLKSVTPALKLDSVIAMKDSEHFHYPFTTPVKEFYEYDDFLRLSQITIKAWNESKKEFGIISKKQFFYNSEGRISYVIMDMIYQSLKFSYNYTYDTSGRLKTFSRISVDNEFFINDLINLIYNDQGKLSEMEYYNKSNGFPILNNVLLFSYNEAGNLNDFKFVFDDNVVAYQTFYEWDSENKLITELFEDYIWRDKTRTAYSYNAIGDIIKSNYTSWENSELKSSGFNEFFYSDFNCSDLVELQNFAEYFYNPVEFKSTKLISKIAHYNGTTFIGNTEYYYSPVTKGGTTGVNNLNIADFKVYPNPATDKITFTWNQNSDRLNLKLFQVTGSCVFDRDISLNETITLEKLPKGTYFYKLNEKQHVLTAGKLIIQ